ncbi:hypothetical protein AWH60_02585 [Pseudoalteromonas haloplanktis]|nr:hypothetical protein AWH60_02585 [Pseudoalteromonas haloplanktis]
MQGSCIDVFPVPENRKYWVVRAGVGAHFFSHFVQNNLVAIGHADMLNLSTFEDTSFLSIEQKSKIISSHQKFLLEKGESKSQIGNKNAQIKRFITDIKKNDIVISVSDERIIAGVIKSDCYFSDQSIELTDLVKVKDVKTCDFSLRYDVHWGRSQSRDNIPYPLERSLKNTGAVFGVNKIEHIQALNHWLFPIHLVNDEVRCSVNIASEKALGNNEVANLSNTYRQLELLSSFLRTCKGENDASLLNFYNFLKDNASTFNYELTVQHAFMSPGVEYLQLNTNDFIKNIYFAAAFAALFNTQIAVADEIKADMRISSSKIAILVEEVKRETKFNNSKSELNLRIKKADKALLELDDGFGEAMPSNKLIL